MTQLNQTKVAQALRDGAIALRKTAAERDALTAANEKLAAENQTLRLRMEAEKLAMDMTEKGASNGADFETLADQLEKKAHADPHGFSVLREAVQITGPDMLKAASVGGRSSIEGTDFERYILGDVS
jgi:hypothetical protein